MIPSMKRLLVGALVVVALVGFGLAAYVWATYKHLNIPRNEPPDFSAEELPFTLEDGFGIRVFAEDLKGARALAFDPTGTVLVAQTSEGSIVALPDAEGDGKADDAILVIDGLDKPHGMAFRCTDVTEPTVCQFYVAQKHTLSVFDYDAQTRTATNRRDVLPLPHGAVGEHYTRSLAFLPAPNDATLLVSVGSSCNVCVEEDSRRATVLSYDVETGAADTYATGLRNAVFLALHPVTGAVWATEMGRDGLGDDTPPDEIDIIGKGAFYGWPYFYGNNVRDTVFGGTPPAIAPTKSHIDIPAHSAPIGLAFLPEEGWPEDHWFDLLVAYHGSWNRSEPTGYKVVRMELDSKGNYAGTKDFITGWLRPDGTTIGRPADVKALPGGTVYVTDDASGVVYLVGRTAQ